jgi:hypothetical protein
MKDLTSPHEEGSAAELPQLWQRWGHLAAVGGMIDCPEMTLLAGDHEPAIVRGRGHILVKSDLAWSFEMQGVPDDVGHALRSLNRLRQDPYDGRLRSRLQVVDAHGEHVSMGWTIPSVRAGEAGAPWVFVGECDSAWLVDKHAGRPVTETLFHLPRHHRSRVIFRRFFPAPAVPGGAAERRLEIAGDEIVLTLFDDADMLTVRAPATERFPLTYTENWLAEPIRIMFGQLAYPRLVARGQSDRTMISIRPCNRWDATSDACGLWAGSGELTDEEGFWGTYSALLRHVADDRGVNGVRNFEPNKVTRLYEEVIQAAHASRWIWALAHASAVEGILLLMTPRGSRRADADTAGVEDLCKHIDGWTGKNEHLRQVAKSAAHRTLQTSAAQALRDLRDAGQVTPDQYRAWDKLRNQVMHGSLVSPYSTAEEDKLLLDLSELLHALTRKLTSAPSPRARPGV